MVNDSFMLFRIIVRPFIEKIILCHSKMIVGFYNLKNRNKSKLFIYTDSRGYEISSIFTRRSYRKSFIQDILKNYYCDVFICPEKHTTLFDFFDVYKNNKHKNYYKVIGLIGVVDFAPRPVSQIDSILKLKYKKIEDFFGLSISDVEPPFVKHNECYEGQHTCSLLGEPHVENISNKLRSIENLIWISCNPIDLNWSGNYFKDRPNNLNYVNHISKLIINKTKKAIDIIDHTDWSLEDVKKYTCDNIHYSKEGMDLITKELFKILK